MESREVGPAIQNIRVAVISTRFRYLWRYLKRREDIEKEIPTKFRARVMAFPPRLQSGLSSPSTPEPLPTMPEILDSSLRQGLRLRLDKLGPFFRVTADGLTGAELGRAGGFIRPWIDGKVLHLDSIRLKRETLAMERSIFGLGLFVGAAAIRHGFDRGCRRAELLAINDSPLFHSRLVRFYTRMGFTAVHEVDGSSMEDLAHMLVWGGRGTRMDADVEDLLRKWSRRLKPC